MVPHGGTRGGKWPRVKKKTSHGGHLGYGGLPGGEWMLGLLELVVRRIFFDGLKRKMLMRMFCFF